MDTEDLFKSASGDSQEEVEEELTAAEVLKKLEDAWLNEKQAPELLEPKMEIVECMLDQVATMEGNLARLKKGDMRIPIHRMELSRIRYMINSYLRIRLDKIQSNIHHYTKASVDNPSRLSQEETAFAEKYQTSLEEHFNRLALRHLPGTFDISKVSPKLPEPNLKTAVFIQVREPVRGIEIRDDCGLGRDETIDLEQGDQHLLQYNTIAHLVDTDLVRLV